MTQLVRTLSDELSITTIGLSGLGIINNNALIDKILGVTFVLNNPQVDAFAGWGRKKSYYRAKSLAEKYQKPLLTLEDGFLRSLDSGIHSRYGLSFVVDDIGIYFDTRHDNRLERLILETAVTWTKAHHDHAEYLINQLVTHRLSKYNATDSAPDLSALAGNDKPHILIIDQVAYDASIEGAGADFDSFAAMLKQARHQYPNHNLWIKGHPAGQGHFSHLKEFDGSRFYLTHSVNPITLLQQVHAVYTVSSHMGFEALMLGKTVHCFGVAWYSGFGLTQDDHAPQSLLTAVMHRRLAHLCPSPSHTTFPAITLHQLFYAAYLRYSFYGDPASLGLETMGMGRVACDIQTAMRWLITNRTHAKRLTGAVLSYNLSRWKSDFVAHFAKTALNTLTIKPKSRWIGAMPDWVQQRAAQPKRPYKNHTYQHVITWGFAHATTLKSAPAYKTATTWCMEDGFIRSNGLGATLLAPLSVVLDATGIYYNATCASDLETLLVHAAPTQEALTQTQQLLEKLTQLRITKYNVGKKSNLNQILAPIKHARPNALVRLVVGQVEDDASVQTCLSAIKKNAHLLADVRTRHPQDILIYKPHPDVEAGLRTGTIDADTLTLADIIAHDIAMPDCLEVCDVVHTISSLTGFEALIRGKQVTCYGLPFYAGFGLTEDINNPDPAYQAAKARRQRTTPLTLLMLAHTTLLAYPLYRLPDGIGLAQAEQVVEYLALTQQTPPPQTPKHHLKRALTTGFMQIRAKILQLKQ